MAVLQDELAACFTFLDSDLDVGNLKGTYWWFCMIWPID